MKASLLLLGIMIFMLCRAAVSGSVASAHSPARCLHNKTVQFVSIGMTGKKLPSNHITLSNFSGNEIAAATFPVGASRGDMRVSNFHFHHSGVAAVNSADAQMLSFQDKQYVPNDSQEIISTDSHIAETGMHPVATDTHLTARSRFQLLSKHASGSHLSSLLRLTFGSASHTNVRFGNIMHEIAAMRMVGITIRQPIATNLCLQVGIGTTSKYYAGLTLKFGGK